MKNVLSEAQSVMAVPIRFVCVEFRELCLIEI